MPPPRREPAFNIPSVVLAFIALCVGIHVVRSYLLTPDQDFEVILAGAFIPVRYSGQYLLEWPAFTTPLTYSLLHGGMAHLAVNMIWLAAFGSPLATRVGPLRFALFWSATTLAAVALHYVLHMDSNAPLVGASGAISRQPRGGARRLRRPIADDSRDALLPHGGDLSRGVVRDQPGDRPRQRHSRRRRRHRVGGACRRLPGRLLRRPPVRPSPRLSGASLAKA